MLERNLNHWNQCPVVYRKQREARCAGRKSIPMDVVVEGSSMGGIGGSGSQELTGSRAEPQTGLARQCAITWTVLEGATA